MISRSRPARSSDWKTIRSALEKTLARWRPSIFIGSSSEGLGIARRVQDALKTRGHVELWTSDELFRPSRIVFSELVKISKTSDFAVLIATPDDELLKRGERLAAMRD